MNLFFRAWLDRFCYGMPDKPETQRLCISNLNATTASVHQNMVLLVFPAPNGANLPTGISTVPLEAMRLGGAYYARKYDIMKNIYDAKPEFQSRSQPT